MTYPVPQTPADIELDPLIGFPPVVETEAAPGFARGLLAPYRWVGAQFATADEAIAGAANGTWGINAESRDMDKPDRLEQPFAAVETVRPYDVQRCVEIAASEITPAPLAWELVHVRIPSGSLCVIEDIPTIFDEVTALDGAGVAILTYAGLNGERLCLDELVHPDPLVTEPLRWRFHLEYIGDSYLQGTQLAYVGPVSPDQLVGQQILPSWNDIRYGADNRWGESKQCLAPGQSIVRVWIEITGPTDRFDVRVGARLGGFWQFGGRRGSALENATIRHS